MTGIPPGEEPVVGRRSTPSHPSAHDSTPVIPDHELLRRIGRGSYGQVWLARNVMGTFRAVKVVYRADFEHDRPFEREFEGIQKFEPVSRTHESQVDILQVGRNEAGYFYYVMELADDQETGQQINPETYAAKSLKSELYRRGRLPLQECLQIGLSLTTALEHLHKHGLAHRDVKPSNIIVINGIPKLADIGLVANLDATMSFVGTAGYLPPEGPGSPQADLYSLGKVLYELCTGRDRQDFPELPTEWQQFVDQQGLLEFNAVLMKACATDVRRRYQSASEMHGDLVLLQTGKSVKRLRLVERRLAVISRIGLAAAAAAVLAVAAYFGAVKQARRAQQAEREMAEQLYAADINRALQFWEQGNLKRAVELLEAHRPDAKSRRNQDLRSFEWFYLWQLCNKDDALRTWHAGTNSMLSSDFSPDGRVLAAYGQDRLLSLWDLASRKPLAAFTNYGGEAWTFSTDAKTFAYASSGGSIHLWDLQRNQVSATLPATNRNLYCLAFATNDNLLAVADTDSTKVTLREIDSQRLLATLQSDNGGYICGVAFSSDGGILAAGRRDNIVTFWDASNRSKLGDCQVSVGFASKLAFSLDNRTLAVAGMNSIVALCDVPSRKLSGVLWGHERQVNDVAFSHDGRTIATASDDTTVRLWDSNSRQLLATFKGHRTEVMAVVFSPNDETLFSADTDGWVKQWATGRHADADVLIGHTDWARSVAFSPDGHTLASAGKDKTVNLWDVATGQLLSTLAGHQRPVYRLAWSSDGRTLATVSGLVTEVNGLGELKLWDVPKRIELVTLTNQNSPFRSIAFAPNGRTLATGSGNGMLALWDIAARKQLAAWVAHSNATCALAFSPDGKILASGSDDNTVKLWEVESRRQISVLSGSAGNQDAAGFTVWCVAFSPDGKLLAAGNDDGTVMLWNLPSRRLFRTLKGTTGKVASLAFSRDGKTLATGNQDRAVMLWHLATGQEMAVLKGHQGFVESVEFSPDGSILASASADKTVRLWRGAVAAQVDAQK